MAPPRRPFQSRRRKRTLQDGAYRLDNSLVFISDRAMGLSRRQFAEAGLASLAFGGVAYIALAPRRPDYRDQVPGYGPLISDPGGILDLPAGFHYSVISAAGETMDDGYFTPDHFDGMGCFPLDSRRVALVRNHELLPKAWLRGASGDRHRLAQQLASESHFGKNTTGRVLPGGTSTIVYDLRREQQYLSLAGTICNCSGGETPWGSWLSCEETVLAPRKSSGLTVGSLKCQLGTEGSRGPSR